MKRSSEEYLSKWHVRTHRKPLVIRGARQTGKSTLVRNFAQARGLTLHEINLEKYSHLDPLFQRLDVPLLLRELELIIGKGPLTGTHCLLFLDEIQATPHALQALRYLYEEMPALAVIAAGSLLEFALADAHFSMPVGRVEYLYLGPLTFEEFLLAQGEEKFLNYLSEYSIQGHPSPFAHDRLLDILRDYVLVGGMPEAVAHFIERKDFREASDVHRSILDTFRDDFGKYATRTELTLLRRIFEYAPQAVGKKVVYSHIDPTQQAREIRAAVDLLAQASVIHRIHHSDGVGVPLGATADDRTFKPLFLDIGLLNTSCGVSSLRIEDLRKYAFVNEGAIAEQCVGQHLLYPPEPSARPALHYWLRDGKQNNAEVDYLIAAGPHVIPVEVKAGAGGSLRSLHQFVAARNANPAIRFDVNPPSIQEINHTITVGAEKKLVQYALLSLPIYMVGQARRIAGEWMDAAS